MMINDPSTITYVLTVGQKEGIKKAKQAFKTYKGFLNADRMGYGKTAQAIDLLKQTKSAVLICPAYLIPNWQTELSKWDYKKKVCVIDSGKQIIDTSAKLFIISYSRIINEDLFKQLYKLEYDLLVCDEAHYLKAWDSQRSRRILGNGRTKKKHIAYRSSRIFLMTGTPIMNRIDELYNLIIRIAPETLDKMRREEFIYKYAGNIYITPWGMKHDGVKNVPELKERIDDIFLSRKKIDHLKERIDIPIEIPLKGAELKKYIKEEEKFLNEHGITEEDVKESAELTKFDISEIAEIRQAVALLKVPIFMKALADLLEKTEHVVIYCYYRNTIAKVESELQKRGYSHRVITGDVAHKKRAEIVNDFQDRQFNVLLATIGALREGVNLTVSDTVCFLEFDWTPANMEQAICRLHRKGQEGIVQVYTFHVPAGIDRYMLRMIEKKAKICDKF